MAASERTSVNSGMPMRCVACWASYGDRERLRVGQADVFGGQDDDAAGDKHRVLAGLKHACEPVNGGVGVGAADGLDEGGDGVEVGVAALVVGQGSLGDR